MVKVPHRFVAGKVMIEVVYEWSSNTTNMVTLDFLVLGKLPPMPFLQTWMTSERAEKLETLAYIPWKSKTIKIKVPNFGW